MGTNHSTSTGWAILCDASDGHELGIRVLGMVDRAKIADRWWTSNDPEVLYCYAEKDLAVARASKMGHNNVRVVPYEMAYARVAQQAKDIITQKMKRRGIDEETGHGGWA